MIYFTRLPTANGKAIIQADGGNVRYGLAETTPAIKAWARAIAARAEFRAARSACEASGFGDKEWTRHEKASREYREAQDTLIDVLVQAGVERPWQWARESTYMVDLS